MIPETEFSRDEAFVSINRAMTEAITSMVAFCTGASLSFVQANPDKRAPTYRDLMAIMVKSLLGDNLEEEKGSPLTYFEHLNAGQGRVGSLVLSLLLLHHNLMDEVPSEDHIKIMTSIPLVLL